MMAKSVPRSRGPRAGGPLADLARQGGAGQGSPPLLACGRAVQVRQVFDPVRARRGPVAEPVRRYLAGERGLNRGPVPEKAKELGVFGGVCERDPGSAGSDARKSDRVA